jgi:chromosome segregation ATPase
MTMSHPIVPGDRLGVLDNAGRVLSIYVPQRVEEELKSERDRLQAEVQDLRQALERARKEIAARDQKIETLTATLEEYLGFTAEELVDLENNGISLGEIVTRLEQEFPSSGEKK